MRGESPKIRDGQDFRNGVHQLIAPESFLLECANALTKKERQKLIPNARLVWDDVMTTAPMFFPIAPLMDRAIEISQKTRHNFYDCLYVALAEQEGCELVTGDEKFVKNLGTVFPFITPLSFFP